MSADDCYFLRMAAWLNVASLHPNWWGDPIAWGARAAFAPCKLTSLNLCTLQALLLTLPALFAIPLQSLNLADSMKANPPKCK